MPAEAQHLRNICALPAGVNTRTTSGFLPQKRQVDSSALSAARAVTLVLDVSFFAILHLVSVFLSPEVGKPLIDLDFYPYYTTPFRDFRPLALPQI